MKEVLASKYKIDEQDSTDELIVIYGLISEPDYTGIYDYTHGLTTVKPTNTGFGCLTFNMTDECVIFKIYETIQLV